MSGIHFYLQVNHTLCPDICPGTKEKLTVIWDWRKNRMLSPGSTNLGRRGICSWCPRCGRCHGHTGWEHRSPQGRHRWALWSLDCSCRWNAPHPRSRCHCSGMATRHRDPPSPHKQIQSILQENASTFKKIKTFAIITKIWSPQTLTFLHCEQIDIIVLVYIPIQQGQRECFS